MNVIPGISLHRGKGHTACRLGGQGLARALRALVQPRDAQGLTKFLIRSAGIMATISFGTKLQALQLSLRSTSSYE